MNVSLASRIGKLDSIRGIAALMVLIQHCGLPGDLSSNAAFFWLPVLWDGGNAVITFFLLSGYVLALQLVSPRRPTYAGFLVRRFFRIWPAYAVTLVLSYLVLATLNIPSEADTVQRGVARPPRLEDLVQNLLMTGSPYAIDGPVWSLFVEMRLSIVFPLLFLLTKRTKTVYAAVLSVVISIVCSRLTHWDMPGFLISCADASRYLCLFVIGALLVPVNNPVALAYHRLPLLGKAAGFVVALLLLVYRYAPAEIPGKLYVPWVGVALLFVYCLYSSVADRLLNHEILFFLGRISYGIYLVHFPLLQVTNEYATKRWALFVVLPLSVLLGWAINLWVERPMIEVGRRLSPPASVRRPPPL